VEIRLYVVDVFYDLKAGHKVKGSIFKGQ
jgi:hypothetical protein